MESVSLVHVRARSWPRTPRAESSKQAPSLRQPLRTHTRAPAPRPLVPLRPREPCRDVWVWTVDSSRLSGAQGSQGLRPLRLAMAFTGQPLPETSISYSLAQIPLHHYLGFAEHLLCAGVALGMGSATENSSSKTLTSQEGPHTGLGARHSAETHPEPLSPCT